MDFRAGIGRRYCTICLFWQCLWIRLLIPCHLWNASWETLALQMLLNNKVQHSSMPYWLRLLGINIQPYLQGNFPEVLCTLVIIMIILILIPIAIYIYRNLKQCFSSLATFFFKWTSTLRIAHPSPLPTPEDIQRISWQKVFPIDTYILTKLIMEEIQPFH